MSYTQQLPWRYLTSLQQRQFKALIAAPNDDGCQAWLGQFGSRGMPVWWALSKNGPATHGQARRFQAESLGTELGQDARVEMSCRNAGCIAAAHLIVVRPQKITDEERGQALKRLESIDPQCSKHPSATFRAKVYRIKATGNVVAEFRCRTCQQQYEVTYRKRRSDDGRRFKSEHLTT